MVEKLGYNGEKGAGVGEKDVVPAEVEVMPVGSRDVDDIDMEKEKIGMYTDDLLANGHIQLTRDELLDLESHLPEMPADKALEVLKEIYKIHKHDPRYSAETVHRIEQFTTQFDHIMGNPVEFDHLIYEMRIFALLCTISSPYPEVRAVATAVDNTEEASLTIRVWVVGTILSAIGCVINAIFALRYPTISISSNVIQLVAYPICVAWGKVMPHWHIFGYPLNPGRFTRKEHLLITMLSALGMAWPPTQHLIFVQAMPHWFDQSFARKAGYQYLGALGTNMMGYGFAGLTRRFLVYPSYCVWPTSLATIALNNALHEVGSRATPILGPGRTTWRASMFKCFWVVFGIYFVWYFFPSYIFPNLQLFDWIAWIKPTNGNLVALTSVNFGAGLGLNPFMTFDWGTLAGTAGMTPMFVPINFLAGLSIAMLVGIIFYYTNAYNTSYLPINSPKTFDNKGKAFTVTNIVDKWGVLIQEKYQQYSEPWMSATRCVAFIGMFMYTSATVAHTLLYNRHEMNIGFRSAWQDLKRSCRNIKNFILRRPVDQEALEKEKMAFGDDIHYKLMQAYPEVPESWYMAVLIISMVFLMVCLGVYTNVTPAVVLFAIPMTVIFTIPIGIVTAVSGLEPSLNTISMLIGSGIAGGDTLLVQYFRMCGSEPAYHAINYANDLKLSHYVKIPPRHMFYVQMWAGFLATIMTVSQWNWLMNIPDVCTEKAPFRLICPAGQSDYSNFIFWGTIGAPRLFGGGKRYTALLIGFPLGIAIPVLFFLLKKRWPRSSFLQSTHPLLFVLSFGWVSAASWGNYVPGLFFNYFSWNYLKRKYLEFWNRYNYVTLAALSAAISVNALIVFFALVFPGVNFPAWWGNPADGQPGCIGAWTDSCRLKQIPAKGYFGADPGHFT